MAIGKRVRQPEEVPGPSNKHQRRQQDSQIADPITQQNPQDNNEEKPARPGPSYQTPQAGPHPPPPNPVLPQQPKLQSKPHPQLEFDRLTSQTDPSQAEPGSSTSETSTCYSQNPSNYDVDDGFLYTEISEAKDYELWGHVEGAVEFIRSSSGLEEDWVAVRPLGKGGNGIAGLWELRGDNGELLNQMVIKDDAYAKSEWENDENSRKVPGEVKIMSKLNKARCQAIPRLFNYRRYKHVYKHRMYMEYCPYKDLSVLITRYRRFRRHLPEVFLWETFYHLVEAAMTMKRGVTIGKSDFEIVHRDIKPCNIFLGRESLLGEFPFFPIAKLGDYGLAFMTNDDDNRNPYQYQGYGTPGYLAPEQTYDPSNKGAHRFSASTNVWGIGATMFEMLTLNTYHDYMSIKYDNNVDIETTKQPEYSQELKDLVKRCLEKEPGRRIRLEALWDSVRSRRERVTDMYTNLDDDGRTRFEYENLVYYVGNEINNMSTGNWDPIFAEIHLSRSEHAQFPDREFPVYFPRFDDDDGPEVLRDGGDHDDADVDGAGDGGEDGDAGVSGRGGGSGEQHVDSIPADAAREDAGAEGLQDDALPAEAAGEDGGVQGWMQDDLTDGLLTDASGDEGSEDGSEDMELQVEEPVSPLPSAAAAAFQAPAPAQAHPVAMAAPPAQAPAVQLSERKLRNGKVVGWAPAPGAQAPAPAQAQPVAMAATPVQEPASAATERKLRNGKVVRYF